MGSFYVKDNISNTMIEEQARVIIYPLVKDTYGDWKILPTMLNGRYNDYGSFELEKLTEYQEEQLSLWNKNIKIKEGDDEPREFDDFSDITQSVLNEDNRIIIDEKKLEIKIIALPVMFLNTLKEEWKKIEFHDEPKNKETSKLMLSYSFDKTAALIDFLEREHEDDRLYKLLYRFVLTNRTNLNYALDYGTQDDNANNMEVLQKYYKTALGHKYENYNEYFYEGTRYFSKVEN